MAKTIAITTEKTIKEDIGTQLLEDFISQYEIFEWDGYNEISYDDLAPEEKIIVLAELVEQFEQAVNEELEEIFKEAAGR